MRARQVKVKVITAQTDAQLETAVQSFLTSAGEANLNSIDFWIDNSGIYHAFITYSE